MLGKLLKRLGGGDPAPAMSDDPFGRDTDKAAVPPTLTFTARLPKDARAAFAVPGKGRLARVECSEAPAWAADAASQSA